MGRWRSRRVRCLGSDFDFDFDSDSGFGAVGFVRWSLRCSAVKTRSQIRSWRRNWHFACRYYRRNLVYPSLMSSDYRGDR